ncbi:TPA: hypothetical protein EYO12_01395 [Candidatus Saccharibacteria bacterium]|nr:hypothetical protein [Candidatus Saccharibacteria bacterium]HIO87370.1 hypothetical protein [Candidatus Saccharibacteria bacterium]
MLPPFRDSERISHYVQSPAVQEIVRDTSHLDLDAREELVSMLDGDIEAISPGAIGRNAIIIGKCIVPSGDLTAPSVQEIDPAFHEGIFNGVELFKPSEGPLELHYKISDPTYQTLRSPHYYIQAMVSVTGDVTHSVIEFEDEQETLVSLHSKFEDSGIDTEEYLDILYDERRTPIETLHRVARYLQDRPEISDKNMDDILKFTQLALFDDQHMELFIEGNRLVSLENMVRRSYNIPLEATLNYNTDLVCIADQKNPTKRTVCIIVKSEDGDEDDPIYYIPIQSIKVGLMLTS